MFQHIVIDLELFLQRYRHACDAFVSWFINFTGGVCLKIEELKKKSVADLKQLAGMMGISLSGKEKKADLVALITGAPGGDKTEEKTPEKPIGKVAKKAGSSASVKKKKGETEQKKALTPAETEPSEEVAADVQKDVAEGAASEDNDNQEEKPAVKTGEFFGSEVVGILEIMGEGYGFLRTENFCSSSKDVFVPPVQIKRFGLRNGDCVKGRAKPQKDHNASHALFYITEINGMTPDQWGRRVHFEQLVPVYPDSKFVLETEKNELSTRIIDFVAPIGRGQRGLIVSPPKAGKTVLLKKIANSITANYPEVELIVLLIDERPEEVTDMKESVKGTVVSSTFDELPERHIKVSELVLERAQRLVESGKDVVILMDSLTRLARAYNLTIPPTGRSLSGGLDPGALHKPKKFFGAARNIRGGGSRTIVATALVETGSRLDDVIFEEFKGTGNMELRLDRNLSEKRIFPAIDISKSGTRKEELLLNEKELNAIYALRKAISNIGAAEAADMIIEKLSKSKDNESFIASLKID